MDNPAEQNSPALAYIVLALVLFPFVLVLVPMFAAAWEHFRPLLEQLGVTEPPL
jgi:hypothetical protein